MIDQDQQLDGSPSQLPEEDLQEQVQRFLNAMPAVTVLEQQPAPMKTLTKIAVVTDPQFQGVFQLNAVPLQDIVTTDAVRAPLLPTSHVTAVTLPTVLGQQTNTMFDRPTFTVPTSVSVTTSSFVTSHSPIATMVINQMMPPIS